MFRVYTGTIRPWFDQPGNGQQYQVACIFFIPEYPASDCEPDNPMKSGVPVQWLLDPMRQYLEEVPPDHR